MLLPRFAYHCQDQRRDTTKCKGDCGKEECKGERDDAPKGDGHANNETKDVLCAIDRKCNRTEEKAQE